MTADMASYREVPWPEVRRVIHKQMATAQNQLLGCPLDQVERIRGRIEAYRALIALELQASASLNERESMTPADFIQSLEGG